MRLGRAGTAVVAAAAAFGVAGLATAAIPGSDGVIDLCLDPRGNVRVVDENVPCAKQESPLAINQQGPPGADGRDGADGVATAEVNSGGDIDLSSGTRRFTDVHIRSESTHQLLAHGTVAVRNTTGGPVTSTCTIRQSPSPGQSTMGDFLATGVHLTVPAGGRDQVTIVGRGTTKPTLAFYSLVLECEGGEGLNVESSTIEALLTNDSSGG